MSKIALSKELTKIDKLIAYNSSIEISIYLSDRDVYSIESESFSKLLKKIGNSNNRNLLLLDSNNNPIYFYDKSIDKVTRSYSFDKNLIEKLTETADHQIKFSDRDGLEMVGYVKVLKNYPLKIIVFQLEKEAYYEVIKLETTALFFVILGIIVAVFVGFYFAKSIEIPINALIKGTEEIRKGNLNFVIQTNTEDEIGHLAKEFNTMTRELKESQDHLVASEKLAALGTMAAGMAHEIKNPLVALRTFTQLLPLKWNDEEFRKKFVSVIPPEIDKINKIAENLLKFGRPSKPDFKPINVENVLEEVLELVDNQIKKNNIMVSTKFAQTPKINGDFSQLSQAFLNIILNAIQAMKNGGELIVKTDVGMVIQLGQVPAPSMLPKKLIEAKAQGRQTPMVFIEITDSGPGISEEVMKNMFDPFYTTKETGTGMGLPITLRIIEEHKGSIKLRSQIGKGTTFIIMLPPIEEKEEDKNQTI